MVLYLNEEVRKQLAYPLNAAEWDKLMHKMFGRSWRIDKIEQDVLLKETDKCVVVGYGKIKGYNVEVVFEVGENIISFTTFNMTNDVWQHLIEKANGHIKGAHVDNVFRIDKGVRCGGFEFVRNIS